MRLENIAPKGAFLYELASRNWVNAYEDTEAKLAELAKGLAHLVRTGARDESVLPFDRSDSRGQASAPSRKSVRKPAIMAAAVIIVAAAVGATLWICPQASNRASQLLSSRSGRPEYLSRCSPSSTYPQIKTRSSSPMA